MFLYACFREAGRDGRHAGACEDASLLALGAGVGRFLELRPAVHSRALLRRQQGGAGGGRLGRVRLASPLAAMEPNVCVRATPNLRRRVGHLLRRLDHHLHPDGHHRRRSRNGRLQPRHPGHGHRNHTRRPWYVITGYVCVADRRPAGRVRRLVSHERHGLQRSKCFRGARRSVDHGRPLLEQRGRNLRVVAEDRLHKRRTRHHQRQLRRRTRTLRKRARSLCDGVLDLCDNSDRGAVVSTEGGRRRVRRTRGAQVGLEFVLRVLVVLLHRNFRLDFYRRRREPEGHQDLRGTRGPLPVGRTPRTRTQHTTVSWDWEWEVEGN
mmetsp:Transcript_8713/g.21116  ORF Transcript_8713/g.21116 Transcript_8713/m.21116 type:complete len:323 (+) Transcript_8713:2114-3082(+)